MTYANKTASIPTPQIMSMWPVTIMMVNRMDEIIIIIMSRMMSLGFADKVATKAVTPMTSRMLAMLEPMTLPSAMPAEPFRLAFTDMTSSGSDVPNATIVKPTTSGETPSFVAIYTAASIVQSPPFISMIMPSPTAPSANIRMSLVTRLGSIILVSLFYDTHCLEF